MTVASASTEARVSYQLFQSSSMRLRLSRARPLLRKSYRVETAYLRDQKCNATFRRARYDGAARRGLDVCMERVVAYLRVSTQRQQCSGLGIEAQRKAIQQFAASESLKVVSEFVEFESGKSADALDSRPQLSSRAPTTHQAPFYRRELRPKRPLGSAPLGRSTVLPRSQD
jgi:hypothetical protein